MANASAAGDLHHPLQSTESHPLAAHDPPDLPGRGFRTARIPAPGLAGASNGEERRTPVSYFDLKGFTEKLEQAQLEAESAKQSHQQQQQQQHVPSSASSEQPAEESDQATDEGAAHSPPERPFTPRSARSPEPGYLSPRLPSKPLTFQQPQRRTSTSSQTPLARTRVTSRASVGTTASRREATSPTRMSEYGEEGTPQMRPVNPTTLDEAEEDELELGPSLNLLAALRLMSDEEIERHAGSSAFTPSLERSPAMTDSARRSTRQPSSPFHPSPSLSAPGDTDSIRSRSAEPVSPASSAALTPGLQPPPSPGASSQQSVPAARMVGIFGLLRSVSRALAQALDDISSLTNTQKSLIERHEQDFAAHQRMFDSREAALRELCRVHGIGEGEVQRCLTRAAAVAAESAPWPVEASSARPLSPSRGRRGGGPFAGDESGRRMLRGHEVSDEQSLPQSLQEAMLEDMSSSFTPASPQVRTLPIGSSSRRDLSPSSIASVVTHSSSASGLSNRLPQLVSALSTATIRREEGNGRSSTSPPSALGTSPLMQHRSHAASDPDVTASATTVKRKSKSRSGSMISAASSSAISAATDGTAGTGFSEWASGLLPWAGAGGRKAMASTAASSVKATSPGPRDADGYLSEAAVTPTTPAQPHQGLVASSVHAEEQPTRSGSSPEARRAHSRAASVAGVELPSVKPNSTTGLGFLGSLAWRRRRPSGATTRGRKPVADLSGTDAPSPRLTPSTSGEREATPEPLDLASDDNRSLSVRSQALPRDADALSCADESDAGASRDAASAKSVRPTAEHTPSGNPLPSALREALGSAPDSPASELLPQLSASIPPSALPKPAHFRAIFLATRVMTPDPASLLYDSGRRTSDAIARLAMSLVGRARDEGKVADEPAKSIGGARRVATPFSAALPGGARGPRASPVPTGTNTPQLVTARASGSSAGAGAATFGRALQRYRKAAMATESGTPGEPNVTRLPDFYRFATTPKDASKSAPTKPAGANDATSAASSTPPPATAVELEPIVPPEAKPPTLALFARRNAARAQAARAARRGGREGALGALDEESSGDEFEVYGGKGEYGSSRTERESGPGSVLAGSRWADVELLTDRYGFVYDATRADVRLLRQAKKAATPAPACLTGIRVGVRARGGKSDSASDGGKEGGGESAECLSPSDDEDLEHGQEKTDEQATDVPTGANAVVEQEAAENTAQSPTEETGGAQSDAASSSSRKPPSGKGLLAPRPAKALAVASPLSVPSRTSLASGPTSPTQELHFQMGGVNDNAMWSSADETSKGRKQRHHPHPPSTSATIRRLLEQLQTMHEAQQSTQKAEWDEFLKRRREKPRPHPHAPGESGGPEGNRDGASSRGGAAGLSSMALTADAGERAPEESWSEGMVGIARMGDSKAGKEDWRAFLRLCQRGVPLVYRAKIWAECSGANEVAEPGRYAELLAEHEGEANQCTNQIDLDVHRTMPTNIFFGGDGPGVPKLRRLLVAFSWHNPECGYCQGE